MSTIATERLDLIPLDEALLVDSLEGRRAEVERRLEAILPVQWPFFPDTFVMRLAQIREKPSLVEWLLRAVVLRETREVVGQIGFHTSPGPAYLEPFSPGAVEFGYRIHDKFRRQGFAREAALGLMRWACEERGVGSFVLSISPENHASMALARQLGFRKIGAHIDEVDGPEDVLELRTVPGTGFERIPRNR